MAQWQIIKADNTPEPELFDDGFTSRPGEPEFTQDGIKAKCASLGEGYTFNYIGTPNWVSPNADAGENE